MTKFKKFLKKKKFYHLLQLCFILAVVLFNSLFNKEISKNKILLIVLMGTVFEYLILAIVSIISRTLPKKLFNFNRRLYRERKFERKLFKMIKVKKWKHLIPEMGEVLVGFSKNKISNPKDPSYIAKFIEETCYAEFIHFNAIIFSFGILLIFPAKYTFCVTLPICIFASLLHMLPIIVQRYNRPKLVMLYNRALRQNESKVEIAQEHSVANNL